MKQKYKIGQKVRIKIYDTEGIIDSVTDRYYLIGERAFLETELEPINEFSIKQLYKPLLAIFILVMIYLALKGCDKPNITQHKTDIPITDAKVTAQVYGYIYDKKIDTVNKNEPLRIIYKNKYIKVFERIYLGADPECKDKLDSVKLAYNQNDSINNLSNKLKDEAIIAGKNYLNKKDSVILKQDVALKSKDAVIDSLTRSKKKYFKGLKHGIIIGAIIVEGLNVGTKFIK